MTDSERVTVKTTAGVHDKQRQESTSNIATFISSIPKRLMGRQDAFKTGRRAQAKYFFARPKRFTSLAGKKRPTVLVLQQTARCEYIGAQR